MWILLTGLKPVRALVVLTASGACPFTTPIESSESSPKVEVPCNSIVRILVERRKVLSGLARSRLACSLWIG